MLFVGAMASIAISSQFLALFAQTKQKDNGELHERDETRQTFRLAPGARIEVSSIRGPVEIETANIEAAEVHIVRSANNRNDLEQYKIAIESTPQSLTIQGEQRQRNSGSGFGPDVRHHVMLRLPRHVDLSINSIGGDVRIGDVGGQLLVSSVSGSLAAGTVDGLVRVRSVSGGVNIGRANQVEITSVSKSVRIEQAVGSINVSGVTGNVWANISKLGQRGIEINSVSGNVELRFTGELNAQLSTNSISGKLSLDVPNVSVQSRPSATSIRAVIGKGGPAISINGVSSTVRLAQGS
jgi:hypothetical protein